MARHRTLTGLIALLLASWGSCAAALDRQGAIDAAKRQVKGRCGPATPCTFSARFDNNKWYVRVEFAKRDSPQDEPTPYPGGHAIFMIDQSGKVVGRIEGK